MFYYSCRYQGTFRLWMVCILLGCGAFFGCSEPQNRDIVAPAPTIVEVETGSQPLSRETVTQLLSAVKENSLALDPVPHFAAVLGDTAPGAPLQRPPTVAEMMAQLRMEFPGDPLDKDFTRIQEIINSETYLDILRRDHPQEHPFEDFDTFWTSAALDPEQYLSFLEMLFEPPGAGPAALEMLFEAPFAEPTATDVAVLHYMTLHQRHQNVRAYHGENGGEQAFVDMMLNEPVHSWFVERFGEGDRINDVLVLIKMLVYHLLWVQEMQEADRAKIQAIFDEHGTQKGFLRLAIQDPVCLGHVVKDFTDRRVFLDWVEGAFRKADAWWD